MALDKDSARKDFQKFWSDHGVSEAVKSVKVRRSIANLCLNYAAARIVNRDFDDADWLLNALEYTLPQFGVQFRGQATKIANEMYKEGRDDEASDVLHLVLKHNPEWEAGHRMVRRVVARLRESGKRDLALALIAPASNALIEKHTFALTAKIEEEEQWEDAIWAKELDVWWRNLEENVNLTEPRNYMPLRNQVLEIAEALIAQGALEPAETLLCSLRERVSGDATAFILSARIAALQEDLRKSVECWQMAAALARPANNVQGGYMISNRGESKTLVSDITAGLRAARCHFAEELLEKGEMREFGEVVCRITESLGSTSVYQKDPLVLKAISTYIRQCVTETHPVRKHVDPDVAPQRIIIVLDVLKLSDFHLHSRVIFTISRSLLERIPDLEIEVVITNERFAVTRPNIASWIDFDGNDYTHDFARRTVGEEYFGSRFKIHFERSYGLEGVVRTCKKIIDLKPDIVAYAGGHGRYSNDSRIVRHALLAYFPSALFFLGVDNVLDDQIDMIIPRGPHDLLGDPGDAAIRVQTYPTLPGDEERVKTIEEKPDQRFIVSALAGARFDTRFRELSDDDLLALFSILDRNPDVVWHFVGAAEPEKLISDVPLLKRYVREKRITVSQNMEINAFREFVTDATLFLQLPGFKGGAGGAGMARRGGVPLLTFENSDVSGRQPPETVFEEDDVVGMAEKAVSILGSLEEAERITQAQFDYAIEIRETSAHGFYDCLRETVSIGAYRINGEVYPFPKPTIVRSFVEEPTDPQATADVEMSDD